MSLFIRFFFISGVGWLLDMSSYAVLTQIFGMWLAYANVVSSMVGVTYVWIVAINRLFDRGEYGKSIYLLIYWSYQGGSIFLYSLLIPMIADLILNLKIGELVGMQQVFLAKIVVTMPSVVTNFIFMNFLVKFMNSDAQLKKII